MMVFKPSCLQLIMINKVFWLSQRRKHSRAVCIYHYIHYFASHHNTGNTHMCITHGCTKEWEWTDEPPRGLTSESYWILFIIWNAPSEQIHNTFCQCCPLSALHLAFGSLWHYWLLTRSWEPHVEVSASPQRSTTQLSAPASPVNKPTCGSPLFVLKEKRGM